MPLLVRSRKIEAQSLKKRFSYPGALPNWSPHELGYPGAAEMALHETQMYI